MIYDNEFLETELENAVENDMGNGISALKQTVLSASNLDSKVRIGQS